MRPILVRPLVILRARSCQSRFEARFAQSSTRRPDCPLANPAGQPASQPASRRLSGGPIDQDLERPHSGATQSVRLGRGAGQRSPASNSIGAPVCRQAQVAPLTCGQIILELERERRQQIEKCNPDILLPFKL